MTDVTTVEPGRWGFSRIVSDGAGGWTTYAMQQKLATSLEAKYPPLVGGVYAAPWALVRGTGTLVAPSDGNTILIPRDLALSELTLGDLTAQQRLNLRNFLETWLSYQFTDFDGTLRTIAGMTSVVSAYTTATLVRDVLRDCYRYLAHSSWRDRPFVAPTHNTEYTDNFSVDSTASWTAQNGNVETYDGANGEMNFDSDNDIGNYYTNDAGGFEHEAQITSGGTSNRALGPGVRMRKSATYEGYGCTVDAAANIQIWKIVAGTRTELYAVDYGSTTSPKYITQRLAAEGANGANVALSYWYTDHGSSKPGADPGWIGVSASPNYTTTDTAADRLDDSAVHIGQGVCGRGNIGGDSNSDWFKLRAISDRSGAVSKVQRFGMLGVS